MSQQLPDRDDLLTQPDQSTLDAELRESSGTSKVTVVLAAVALAGAAFAGGVWAHSALADDGQPAAAQPGGGMVRGPGGGGGQGGPRSNSGPVARGITGTVVRVDGQQMVIKTENGQEITVALAGDTKVQVATPGTVADLTNGATVAVQGQPENGTIKAQVITKQP
ncbi:hypothetical protein EV193_105413 [Herbihabitans rhizosphaerae]|uniref:DUF5666 domain-containing protein n=1 Tax=Herbihabitans rhizosphaerae TaxID=1872711 RepID=A0A4V2ESK1_9PSEU|nr:hypothetical protein [Herbihabitans rhizosphaerae]RZS37853.1 hypothetical protein EV193_105413 [Herbihabitans rhizosphaerae]